MQSYQNPMLNEIKVWIFAMLFVNFFFLIELVIDWIVFGFSEAYKQHLRVTVETICQVINLPLTYSFWYTNNINKQEIQKELGLVPWLYMIILVRALKMLNLLEEIKSLRMIT